MTRRTLSLVAVMSLILLGCAGLSDLMAPATPTIPPDLPPLEIATEMPVATDEVIEETDVPGETDESPVDEPTDEASGEPTDEEPVDEEPAEPPVLELISAEEASRIVMVKEIKSPGVSSIALSPEADSMAEAVGNNVVVINMPWPAGAVEMKGHTGKVNAVSWSPDGLQLASASDDGTLRIWDPSTGEEVSKYDVDGGGLSTVAWSPDGALIAVGLRNGNVQIIEVEANETALTFDAGGGVAVSAITWSSDGSTIAAAAYGGGSAAGSVQIWDATTGEAIEEKPAGSYLAPGPTGIAWSPLEDIVAWVDNKDLGHVALWIFGEGKKAVVFTGQNKVASIAWAPDGDMIASGGFDHMVEVWDPAEGTGLAQLKGHKDTVYSVAWAADGTYIVSADGAGSVRIWGIPEAADEEE